MPRTFASSTVAQTLALSCPIDTVVSASCPAIHSGLIRAGKWVSGTRYSPSSHRHTPTSALQTGGYSGPTNCGERRGSLDVPCALTFSSPCLEPTYPSQPQRCSTSTKVLIKLEDFENLPMCVDRSWPWNHDMNKGQFTPTYHARCIVLLPIHNNILKEGGIMVKRQTVGVDCPVRTAVYRCRGEAKTYCLSKESISVR